MAEELMSRDQVGRNDFSQRLPSQTFQKTLSKALQTPTQTAELGPKPVSYTLPYKSCLLGQQCSTVHLDPMGDGGSNDPFTGLA